MVFQSYALFPHLTVGENIIFGLRVRGLDRSSRDAKLQATAGLLGLDELLHRKPSQLSGGQQQRVAIARALAMDPDLLLVDEPTSALDPELISEVLTVLRNLANDGTTMIIVTHELGFAVDVADRLIYMDDGTLLEQGRPEMLIKNPQTSSLKKFLESVSKH